MDPQTFEKILDIFAGRVVKFPGKDILENCIRDANIYHEMKRDRTGSVVTSLASMYGISESFVYTRHKEIKRIVKEAGI